jgi:D-lactate dehydrogenase
MKIAVFSTQSYDRAFLEEAAARSAAAPLHDLVFLEPRLSTQTAALAAGFPAVCVFVNDDLNAEVIRALAETGTRLILLRCAGFNNVDLEAAQQHGLRVARVPAYSPNAVAEHTVALMLTLNRKTHRAFSRVREGNFSLEGLLGFDLHGRAAGIIGTGAIGLALASILRGFGCRLLAFDPFPREEAIDLGVRYVSLPELYAQSEIISVHCPLTPETHHMIDDVALEEMRDGVMLINTSRGAVIDTRAVIAGLKSGKIGYLGLDVYEEEGDLFFRDLSDRVIQDDVFSRLLTFPNVLITGHQGFFTREALREIAHTTVANASAFERSGAPEHEVGARAIVGTR